MRNRYFLLFPLFFLILFISPVIALNIETNTTLTTAINQRALSCVNASEDVEIYCYLATGGGDLYQYYDNFTHIKTCDLTGTYNGMLSVGAVNSTHVYIGHSNDIYLINITSCGGEETLTNALSGYNNLNLDYYATEQWLYADRSEAVIDVTDGSTVFYGDWTGYTAIIENKSSNNTIWLNTYDDGDAVIENYSSAVSVDVNSVWGFNSLYYTFVKVDDATTWLYTYQDGAVSSQIYAIKLNFTEGIGTADLEEEETEANNIIEVTLDLIGGFFGVELEDSLLLLSLLLSVGFASFVVIKTKGHGHVFIGVLLASLLICWGFGWIADWLIILLGFALIVVFLLRLKGG